MSILQEVFSFPDEVEISGEAKDLMKRLICSMECRFGKNGLEDFRSHPFFAEIDWDNVRDCKFLNKGTCTSINVLEV